MAAAHHLHPAGEDDQLADLPRHPARRIQEIRKTDNRIRHDLGRTRLAATAARMESRTLGSREPPSCPRCHLPRRRLHAPNAPANNAITLAIIIRNKRKLPKPFNSFVDTTMPTSASRSCTQSQDQADRASLPDRNCKLSSPATKASRSPRIRRPIAPRAVTARQQISKSQPRTRRPAPRSGLRSHHINKHGITLPLFRTGAVNVPASRYSCVCWPTFPLGRLLEGAGTEYRSRL